MLKITTKVTIVSTWFSDENEIQNLLYLGTGTAKEMKALVSKTFPNKKFKILETERFNVVMDNYNPKDDFVNEIETFVNLTRKTTAIISE